MTATFSGEVHPAADLFPMMSDDELAELATDIADHGLRSPIVLDDGGRLVDGRNRLAACRRAEVLPRFVTYKGDNIVSFIASVNVQRRHLSPSQRAMVAAEMLPHFEAEAKARQAAAGGDKRGARPLVADLPQAVSQAPKARDEAAKATGASPRNVQKAKTIVEADPDLAEQVKAGDVTINAAEKQVRSAEPERRRDELRAGQTEEERLKALAERDADLADKVEKNVMSLSEAEAVVAQRDDESWKRFKAECKAARDLALGWLFVEHVAAGHLERDLNAVLDELTEPAAERVQTALDTYRKANQ